MKIRKVLNYIYYFLLTILVVVILATIISALNLPGGFKLYTVQSGSMDPTIKMGSLVVSKKSPDYQVDDIITFSLKDYINTHRVVDIKEDQYITKGDANDTPDSQPVFKNQVLGLVAYTIPFLGYPVSFAKTQTGFILLIVIPATIIIYSEALVIKKELKKVKKKSKKTKKTKKSKK